MIDVDNFKQYNDSFGHQVGDKLLTEIALLLKAATRSIDYAARYGGDEFVLLLHEINAPDAMLLAERLRKSVAAATFEPGHHKVTVSIGVASYPDHGDKAQPSSRVPMPCSTKPSAAAESERDGDGRAQDVARSLTDRAHR